MKKLAFLVIMVLGLLGVANNNSNAATASGHIKINSAYGPNDDVVSTFGVFGAKVHSYLQKGTTPGAQSNDPVAFWLASGEFNWRRAMTSSTASLWNGVLNPSQYGEQRGGRLLFPTHVVSSEPFTPVGVKIGIRSNDPYQDHPLGSLGYTPTLNSWSSTAVGIWWGQDQVKGTTDDVVRTSGAEPVNELSYTGPGVSYAANSQADIDRVQTYMAGVGSSFEVFITVSVVRADGSLLIPAVTHRAGDNSVPRIVLSSDGKYWIVASESTEKTYHVQESSDLTTWSTQTRQVTAGETVAPVANTGVRFFRLQE